MDDQPGQPLDRRAELGEFLRTRRARLRPEDVGITGFGGQRRVPGLRREELAQLAGISVAYYTRLEQGNGRNVSAQVLDAIARVLRLTDAEHAHLTHLVKPKQHKKKQAPRPRRVRPALTHLLNSMGDVPAYVVGRHTEVLAWNRMALALSVTGRTCLPGNGTGRGWCSCRPSTASCSWTGSPRRPTS